jgi:type IV pilus assembly protein PilX
MPRLSLPRYQSPHQRQRGVALFVVIVLVMLSMLLAVWSSRTSLFNEMLVGNDADYQRAFEAAQALLQDAELDIRGENPNGGVCTSSKCRNNVTGAARIPLDPQEVTPLLAELDQEATKCKNGLCAKRTGRQDFWNYVGTITPAAAAGEFSLAAMSKDNVGARYGDYSGATLGNTSSPASPILADRSANNRGGWYWIEVMYYDESSKNSGLIVGSTSTKGLLSLNLKPNVVYRITALAYGRKSTTMAVLQQTYARQIRKD